ncbi:MAG: hypothetical protein R3B09_26710 [Nannocystaceae bacterium]
MDSNNETAEALREILAAERDAARDHIHDLESRSYDLCVKLRRARKKIRTLETALVAAVERARGLEARARRAEAHCDDLARSGRSP